jgi:16S rRNA (cytosine967-C5)-methyltransferase
MTPAESQDVSVTGREAAYFAVLDVLEHGGFASEALRTLRAAGRLSGRDAGLATQIALGAVRHSITIEHVLAAVARFDRQRVEPRLRAILHAAAYQIIWMDRVPAFAAVNEAVEQARRHVGGRSPAMVNAVLRNLARAIAEHRGPWQRLDPRQIRISWDQACTFDRDVLPPTDSADTLTAHLAAAAGEREARYRELVARCGPDAAEQVAWASQSVPPTVLQRNTLLATPDEFGLRIRAAFGATADLTPDATFLPPEIHIGDAQPFTAGLAFVQDPTAHAAALLVEARPGERVLDLCAAPGGKSAVLAMQMGNEGEVVASDVSPARLERVRENIARLGLTCVRAGPPPGAADSPPSELFDAALVDVPCSNTGVIARRPEARLTLSKTKLRSLVRAQQELIRIAARHVRPGGRLVYSTCSLEPAENDQVVDAFLAECAEWLVDCRCTTLPAWGPRLADWHDGGFAARLRRR